MSLRKERILIFRCLTKTSVRIRTLSLFYEQWIGKLPLAELVRVSLLFDIGELHRQRYVRSKRVIDVALGLVGSGLLAVVRRLISTVSCSSCLSKS